MSKPQKIRAEQLIKQKFKGSKSIVKDKDAILYALGIGFSQDPLREQDFKYTNQFHQNFTTFPTMGVVSSKTDLISPLLESSNMPQFSPFVILHAQQKLTLFKQKIEVDTQIQAQTQIADVVDKGKNAFILFREKSYVRNANGQKQLAYQNDATLFLRGLGGFNFPGKGQIKPPVQIPKRKPDYTLNGQTFAGQAFIYRLSLDVNPLHIDPNIAKAQKFDRPILHGLASYGTVARVIVQNVLNNDPSRFKSFQARFVGHVYPGETLQVLVWKNQNILIYQASVKQRKTKALVGYLQTKQSPKL